MYPRFAFTLLFSFAAIGLGIAIPAPPVDERCGPNAHYLLCGSACAPTCANPNPGPACTRQCVIGCFCNEGYLKNAQGQCVRQLECDGQTMPRIPMQIPAAALPTCPDNEEFQACGSACAPTCAHPHPSPMCTKNCVVGCFCKDGHLRNGVGVCVAATQCDAPKTSLLFAFPPQECQGENEIYLACGSACAPTCANPNPGPICTLQCVTGCFCKPGFLKNEEGRCVAANQCDAKVCGMNEEFRQCKGCDGTCEKPNPICPRICIPGCACKQGHLRSGPNGECIPKEQCPAIKPLAMMMLPPIKRKCSSDHEMYVDDCGTQLDCMATCHMPPALLVHGAPQIPKKCLERKCAPSCVCQTPYVRNEQGQCVEKTACDPSPFTTRSQ